MATGEAHDNLDVPKTRLEPSPVYLNLNPTRREIRLLTLQPSLDASSPIICSIKTSSLNDFPKYEAISYAWGDPGDTAIIKVNGADFAATTNLIAALRQFRELMKKDAEVQLWIDAICINQGDLQERSHQVAMMRNIYKQAMAVRAWLGEVTGANDATAGFEIFSVMVTESHDWHSPEVTDRLFHRFVSWSHQKANTTVSAIQKLFELPYWHRLWVVQELALAPAVTFQYGERSCNMESEESWNMLVALPNLYARARTSFSLRGDQVVTVPEEAVCPQLVAVHTARALLHYSEDTIGKAAGDCAQRFLLPALLTFVRPLLARNACDYVHGLLGILPFEVSLPTEHPESPAILYERATVCWIQHDSSLHMLDMASFLTSNLPSWVVDFGSKLAKNDTGGLVLGRFYAPRGRHTSCHTRGQGALNVPALFVGTVVSIAVREGFETPRKRFQTFSPEGNTNLLVKELVSGGKSVRERCRTFNITSGLAQNLSNKPPALESTDPGHSNARKLWFVTDQGDAGVAELHCKMELGDRIAIIESCRFPMVLRKGIRNGNSGHLLVGSVEMNCIEEDELLHNHMRQSFPDKEPGLHLNEVFECIDLI